MTVKPDIQSLLEPLTDEQQAALAEVAIPQRLSYLAELLNDSPRHLLVKIAEVSQIPLLNHWKILPNPSEYLPQRLILEYQCVPIESDKNSETTVALLTLWPPVANAEDWIFAISGKRPVWFLGDPEKVGNEITQSFGVGSESLESSEIGFLSEEEAAQESEDENAAIIKFVNEIISKALKDRATDIHFEPQKETLQIRYRIDGELVPITVPQNLVRFQSAIISRIKLMARLNISEKRRPQDGRISFGTAGGELDIRISTLPTMYGESVSMRLLTQSSKPVTIHDLGFPEEDEAIISASLQRPHGIILVTGPTGSGKSTTLTAFIRRINTPERRVITVEDPVEYEVPGVNQTQVHHEIGLDFSNALRTVLRQDPDVIMVGEIRDRETADIAIRASLTGHLVFSTLHTNDAPGALTRLTDMEIEPFLIASSVELVIAQRLVRRLCPVCSRQAKLEPGYLESCLRALGLDLSEVKYAHLVKEAVGCEACRKLGYKGRVGIFEILRVTDEIHDLITAHESAKKIREVALKQGMRSLQECGWEHVKRGWTSLSEIMHYADLSSDM